MTPPPTTAQSVDLLTLTVSSWPAVWAAIAATCSAIAAVTMVVIQRRNLLESVRPELILEGWSRREEGAGDGWHEVIAFDAIRNVGRGAALHVRIFGELSDPPTALVPTFFNSILPAGETVPIAGHISVWWKNVVASADDRVKYLDLPITLWASDTRDMRHQTRYHLLVIGGGPDLIPRSGQPSYGGGGLILGLSYVAPGVALVQRHHTSTPGWRLRLGSRGRRTTVNILNRLKSPRSWAATISRQLSRKR